MNETSEQFEDHTIAVPKRTLAVPVPQQLLVLGAILFLIFGTAITASVVAALGGEESGTTPAALPESAGGENKAAESSVDLAAVTISGEAAYVFDIANQRVLYKKNETEVLPLASITKLMTALVADEILGEKAEVQIGDTALRQDGDSGFAVGETFSREALLDLTLMSSSNDGAYALAAAAGQALTNEAGATAFVQAMNIRAKELGLHDTQFKNPTGLDISPTESGANGTAKDVAFLMEYLVQHRPDILAYTTKEAARLYNEDGSYHDAENTNYYLREIPGLIASKTGYTELAGGNLVVAFNAGLNRPIVVAVLGSTRSERFTDVVTLTKATQTYVTAHDKPNAL